jgi:NAD(P)-dependent dehydrogenase (short-subunit alcohol dehydrogenase family)
MITDLTGKVALVTGANAGIGKPTALGLAQMGAEVVLLCRNKERGEEAQKDIREWSGNEKVHLLVADLASQAAIRKAVREFKQKFPSLRILINNAGIITRERILTSDGMETQLAINHLAPFLLTNLLLDTIKRSAPARIINVSAKIHHIAKLDLDNLQSENVYSPVQVYARTNIARNLFTLELSRRLEGTGVTANCLHPGVIRTQLAKDFAPGIPSWMTRRFTMLPEQGAQTSLYLASSPAVTGVTGKYFNNKRIRRASRQSRDSDLAEKLWDISTRLTGL